MTPKRAATTATAEQTPNIVTEAVAIFQPSAISGVYVGPDGSPLGLYARLARIMSDLPDVAPAGVNEHFRYKFISSNQILGLLRPRLARQLILIYPETVEESPYIEHKTGRGGDSMVTRLLVTFRVADGITGEAFTGQAMGYGDDPADKGANKAFTAAYKNFLIKLFSIGGEADIEEDVETDLRAQARESGVRPAQKAVIGEAVVETVARGGRSQSATEAQVAHVSRLVGQLNITNPVSFANIVDTVLGDPIEFASWPDVRKYLEQLSGVDIGKLIGVLAQMQPVPTEMSDAVAEAMYPDDIGAK